MHDYDKIFKELQKTLTMEEIAEGYMIPRVLSPEERKKGDEEFLKIRLEMRKNRTKEQILRSEMMRLKINIEDYLKGTVYKKSFSFGYLLNRYIQILEKKKDDFAKDIDINVNQLNRVINEKEVPEIGIMYRLEKHSNGRIPALYWWKILAREIENTIDKNEAKRQEESKKVSNALTF